MSSALSENSVGFSQKQWKWRKHGALFQWRSDEKNIEKQCKTLISILF